LTAFVVTVSGVAVTRLAEWICGRPTQHWDCGSFAEAKQIAEYLGFAVASPAQIVRFEQDVILAS
jgi:hypothetical protein